MFKKRKLFSFIILALLMGVIAVMSNQGYAQDSARNIPPNGKVRFFVGQTSPDLTQFRNEVVNADASFNAPGGITLYTHIVPGQCNGTSGSCNLGNSGNIMDFNASLNQYPGAALAVGLFLADPPGCYNQPLRALLNRDHIDPDLGNGVGQAYRDNMDNLINYLQNTGREVYLRIGYEFDGPWNCYNTEFYIGAFRYVKGRIDALGANNIATVWQSATFPQDGNPQYNQDFSNPNHFNTWYPGDQYVDWVGISTFYFNDYKTRQWACMQESIQPVTLFNRALDFARAHNKPVFISESSSQGYQNDTLTASCINTNQQSNIGSANTIWNEWYADYFAFINANTDVIRAISYINSDWEQISQFNCAPGASAGAPNCTDGYWGDTRIQANSTIYNNFKSEIGSSIFEGGSGGPNPTATPSNPTATPINPTATPIIPPTATPGSGGDTIASDDFENGTGGGSGWNGSWSLSGQSIIVTNSSNSVDGTHHLRLRSANGLATRYVDMSGVSNGRLQFWWRANSFESGEEAYVRVNDGSGWNTIMTVVNGQDTNSWTYADLDISGYNTSSNFGIRFDSQMSSTGDQFRVDALAVVGNSGSGTPPTPTPPPGGNNIPGTLSNNVGAISNNQTVSWNANVTQAGNYIALISSTSNTNSQLIDVTFNGSTLTQAIDAGQTITVYFFNVPSGSNTFSITARSNNVSIGSVVVNSN